MPTNSTTEKNGKRTLKQNIKHLTNFECIKESTHYLGDKQDIDVSYTAYCNRFFEVLEQF